jgi:hypothetical protein
VVVMGMGRGMVCLLMRLRGLERLAGLGGMVWVELGGATVDLRRWGASCGLEVRNCLPVRLTEDSGGSKYIRNGIVPGRPLWGGEHCFSGHLREFISIAPPIGLLSSRRKVVGRARFIYSLHRYSSAGSWARSCSALRLLLAVVVRRWYDWQPIVDISPPESP